MIDNLNSINSNEQNEHKGGLLERIRNSSRKVLAPVIAAGSISFGGLPAATVPVTGAAVATVLTACSDEPDNPNDTIAPTVNVSQHDVDITGGKQVRISGNQLYIGNVLVASRTDNVTQNCTVELSLNGKTISSGTTISEEGYLTVKVRDDAGNTRTVDIKLNIVQNAPSITVNKYEVNVFGGVTVSVNNNKLLFGDEVIATRTDENLESCNYALNFNGRAIKSGDVINESGKFTLSITNKFGKSSVVEITITNDAIYGLENLRQASLKVDQEINLLNGLTFADGAELVKTEIEMNGSRSTITDPTQYTPSYPGICNIIFTVKGKSGNTAECRVDNLTINALDYNAPTINTANMINEHYARYNNLQSSTRDFIYPHLLASYAACNRSKQNNRAHVIMGETANTSDIENISGFPTTSEHAYEGYYRIRALSPDVSIKACSYWSGLENYVNNHPNDFFVISCASDMITCLNWNQLNNYSETLALRRLLEQENVIICVAAGNRTATKRKIYNESIKTGDIYHSGSVNSTKNNKITVVGYNTWGANNFFSPLSTNVGLLSNMPVGYDKDKGNIVMPITALISSSNKEDKNSSSSYPTAVTSGVLGNAISVVMSNHPGITAEDAMTIIVNNYLNEQIFQYKDETTNYNLVDGGERYFVDIQKLLDVELLQSEKINNIQLNSNLVKLPSGKGICYVGKGIQFEFNGKKYDTTSASQSILNQALKSGNITRYRNKDMFKKYGGTNSAQFDIYVVDKQGNKIPNLHKIITKSVI